MVGRLGSMRLHTPQEIVYLNREPGGGCIGIPLELNVPRKFNARLGTAELHYFHHHVVELGSFV